MEFQCSGGGGGGNESLNSTGRKSMDQENANTSNNTTNNSNNASSSKSKNPLRILVGKLVFLDLPNSGKQLSLIKECLSCVDVVSRDLWDLFFRLCSGSSNLDFMHLK